MHPLVLMSCLLYFTNSYVWYLDEIILFDFMFKEAPEEGGVDGGLAVLSL